jgi:sorting nexin-29
VGEYQCGFRKGRSTTDHIFVVKQLMEKHYEYTKDLHIVFVDYKQDYDSVDWGRPWEALRAFGIPMKIIKMVKLCNSKTYSRVKFGNELSMAFKIKSGLRQGLPILFNVALESVV